MGQISISDLRARVRERADMVGSLFVTDTTNSVDAAINTGLDKLYDIMVGKFGDDYFAASIPFTLTPGQNAQAVLPSDFYKLLGVDLQVNGAPVSLQKFNFAERAQFGSAGSSGAPPSFRLSGNSLLIYPAPTTATTGVIWYVPSRPALFTGDPFPVWQPNRLYTMFSYGFPVVMYDTRIYGLTQTGVSGPSNGPTFDTGCQWDINLGAVPTTATPAWKRATIYTTGQSVLNKGCAFVASFGGGGTSSTTGDGPAGSGTPGNTLIVDGHVGTPVTWVYLGAAPGIDVMPIPGGWEEFAVLYAAILLLNKEESDVAVLMSLLAEEKARIIVSADIRDAGTPDTLIDTDNLSMGAYF